MSQIVMLLITNGGKILSPIGSLSMHVFETRTATGSELFSLSSYLHTTTFMYMYRYMYIHELHEYANIY